MRTKTKEMIPLGKTRLLHHLVLAGTQNGTIEPDIEDLDTEDEEIPVLSRPAPSQRIFEPDDEDEDEDNDKDQVDQDDNVIQDPKPDTKKKRVTKGIYIEMCFFCLMIQFLLLTTTARIEW